MLAGAAIIFFAYIGFDSVSTHAEEARAMKSLRLYNVAKTALHNIQHFVWGEFDATPYNF